MDNAPADPDEEEEYKEESFPWEDIEASRRNKRLQRKHPPEQGIAFYGAEARPCPTCAAPASSLSWIYFESPAFTWQDLCGRAGWLTACDTCHRQVDFFLEALN